MKKIIFTVTNDLTYDQRMQRICGSLAAHYDVLLAGIKHQQSVPLSEKKYKQKRIFCWFKKGKLFYAEYNIRLFFFLLFQKADCICAIDLDTILPCYLVSRVKGTRRVYDAHEYFSQLNEVISRPVIYRFWHWLERKMFARFKKGYTVCQSLADEFKNKYGVSYEVIRNVPVLTPLVSRRNSEKIVLYQGAVNKGRGLENLALAMETVNPVLWICGDGNFMPSFRQLVSRLAYSEKIKFTGLLQPGELRLKTAEAYIAVNPFERNGLNQYLSLANKFFDYIHAGIPQVTMNYPEYSSINKEYKVALLIDDLKPETIAAAINRLLNDSFLYEKLMQNCVIAREKLNWQNEETKLISFYKKLFDE